MPLKSHHPTEEGRKITLESVMELGGQQRTSLRDRLFYIGVVLVFTAVSAALAYVVPVTAYDCLRDDDGIVSCTVQRRLYGLIPLPEISLSNIESAETKTSTHIDRNTGKDFTHGLTGVYQDYSKLVLHSADGTNWTSSASSFPLEMTQEDLARGINDLLEAQSPQEFHGWIADKVLLLISVAFLAPLTIIGLALLARILLANSAVRSYFVSVVRKAISRKAR